MYQNLYIWGKNSRKMTLT